MTKENNTPQEIWDAIMAAENPICIIDSRFDYDAFGSALALRKAMESKGKRVRLIHAYPKSEHAERVGILDFSNIEFETDPIDVDFTGHDLIIRLDSSTDAHGSANEAEYKSPSDIKSINIDHHPTNELYADLNYVEHGAGAACGVLYHIFKQVGIDINTEIATCLLAGLYTDTGTFQYEDVSPEDVRIAAELMELGGSIYEISYKLNFNVPLDELKFRELIYSRLTVENDYAYSYFDSNELDELRINMKRVFSRDADLIKRLEDVKFVFTVRRGADGLYRVSFRSHEPNIDVSILATELGGGGHKPAAGGTIEEDVTMEEAIEITKKVIKENRDKIG